MQRTDNQLLVVTHLSQLLDYITGFGGLIVPLILWLCNKETIYSMDDHGKAIINFQLSILIYTLISIPLILLLGLGILTLIFIGIIAFVFPIINAIKASNGEEVYYPFSLNIIK
ncbi:DUF4870 domain-containing protein [Galbibacter sp. EGI 63066]|uniref:DUF4870 domain-containing protein n=1 Tax=Galbibacter sp. EGI 63066 TaxID=2993559 RepID=UPI002248D6EF|nr:DUF4870 domain-containing protein [Galbibacter sp. EGI 63066]MCX2679334.1 DUF4870 domain-containing protein [Galbibacter sp. EGI 63066]